MVTTSNKYTCCVPAVGNLGNLCTYLQFFSLHTYSFSGLGSWKCCLSSFQKENLNHDPTSLLPVGPICSHGATWLQWLWFSQSAWQTQILFGGHWDQREHSATTLLLYIHVAHFIREDNKGISQVLDTHHHWNAANLPLEAGEQILHGSQQTHWGRQCFGYNSSINCPLA